MEDGHVFKAKITQRKRITVIRDKSTSPELTQSQQELRHIIPSLHHLSLQGGYSSILFIWTYYWGPRSKTPSAEKPQECNLILRYPIRLSKYNINQIVSHHAKIHVKSSTLHNLGIVPLVLVTSPSTPGKCWSFATLLPSATQSFLRSASMQYHSTDFYIRRCSSILRIFDCSCRAMAPR